MFPFFVHSNRNMAHLSPPPSPPNALANISLDGTSSNLIQRASAFNSVLGQKWNPRGKLLGFL